MTVRDVPTGYTRPPSGHQDSHTHYYLTEEPDYHGATPLFAVMCSKPGEQRCVAQKCYVGDGITIVDALRKHYARERGHGV